MPSRGPPCYGILEMPTKPVTTRATTATRAGCVRHGLRTLFQGAAVSLLLRMAEDTPSGSPQTSAFCVLVFSSTIGVRRIPSSGPTNMPMFKANLPLSTPVSPTKHENPFSDMYVVVMNARCCKAWYNFLYCGDSNQPTQNPHNRRGCSAKKRGVGTPFPRVPTPLHPWFRLKANSNIKYRSDALTRKKLLWFSQSTQEN